MEKAYQDMSHDDLLEELSNKDQIITTLSRKISAQKSLIKNAYNHRIERIIKQLRNVIEQPYCRQIRQSLVDIREEEIELDKEVKKLLGDNENVQSEVRPG